MTRCGTAFRAIGITTALVASTMLPGVRASSASDRVVLSRSASRFASAVNLVRRVDPASRVDFELYLGFRRSAEAEALLRQVSTPGTPTYRHYLDPAAFRAEFARPASDVATVSAWLRSQGFTVGAVPANHTTVAASGTAAQVNRAFDVRLGYYRTRGGVRQAPDRAPSVPSPLGGIVRGVLGLTPVLMHHGSIPPPAAWRSGKPCGEYWAAMMATNQPPAFGRIQPRAVCGYTPAQMEGAYGFSAAIASGNDGTGVTVAVVDAFAAPTMQQDLDVYSARHGLATTTIQQFTQPPVAGAKARAQQGWWGEEALDLEAVHTMAPGAGLVYWGAASASDRSLRYALGDLIDNHRAEIVTNSYGNYGEQAPASNVDAWHDLFVQAGVEGISICFSSGDDGDDISAVGYRTTELPTSDPLVTAVGGTSLAVGAFDSYLFETGLGIDIAARTRTGWTRPSYSWGGGGGTSRIFAEPWYQQGVVPGSLAGYWGGSNRVVPDIAMDGDSATGLLEGETQTFLHGSVRYGEYRIGGTSLSSPLFAGVLALADQAAGVPLGFANPFLYTLGGTGALHDIVSPTHPIAVVRTDFNNGVNKRAGRTVTLRVMNRTGTLSTTTGYDDVTGMGTPDGQGFLDAVP